MVIRIVSSIPVSEKTSSLLRPSDSAPCCPYHYLHSIQTHLWRELRVSWQLFCPVSQQNCSSSLIQNNKHFSCNHIKTTPESVHNPVPKPLPVIVHVLTSLSSIQNLS
jgi:hypothetical protein